MLGCYNIFQKIGLFSPKIGGRKKVFKIRFSYFKTKTKVPMAIKLEGRGGKALMAWPLVEELFLRLPLGKPQKPLAIKIYFFYFFYFVAILK